MRLDPLFAPHEEPQSHRARNPDGAGAILVGHRRPSPVAVVNNLRVAVRQWREAGYPGASETSKTLLGHWFEREHPQVGTDGVLSLFRYYFCQREAVETMIYLYEVKGVKRVSALLESFGDQRDKTLARGLPPGDNRWPRQAFKMATGSGKTKVMSLAIVWSYFHTLREQGSTLARHFVVIAPNLTVFERLREDFKPATGGPDIFDRDPLIPPAWRSDWNMTTLLQDEASGAPTGGTLYLTNIHRLYDRGDEDEGEEERDEPMAKKVAKKAPKKLTQKQLQETHPWFGPAINKAAALDTAAALRARITEHEGVMVLNDEAHHLWDPKSAWNDTIAFLHAEIGRAGGTGVIAQLDFSATPKDDKGKLFKHIICDTPLGEAVDGGIVKTPLIGRGDSMVEGTDPDASLRYESHLRLGYARWLMSEEEWKHSGKKPLLFVMCEDTKAADEIAHRLNNDPIYEALNGKTINLHTNLKGKIKWLGGKAKNKPVFEASEKDITEEDLKALRELSRQLDSDSNPYTCIVSVLMLREGWDVRNVTTIVPLRPLTATNMILPEQMLGRGLRRMTPPGSANEVVSVVEHPSLVALYEQELEQQGLVIETIDAVERTKTIITIYPDVENKDVAMLDISIPAVSAGVSRTQEFTLGIGNVQKRLEQLNLTPLPVGEARSEEIRYQESHLITGELINTMEVRIPLLCSGMGAISFFREELERACGLRGRHSLLAPLLEVFLTEMIFEENLTLFDQRLVSRMGDADVRNRVRAVFLPLLLNGSTQTENRRPGGPCRKVSSWKPFQVSCTQERPVVEAKKTAFNLVPCDRGFEVCMSRFLDGAKDVVAFAKNAGPQALRIDYVNVKGHLSFYTPDFLVRLKNGRHLLVETKGREDRDVPGKARAAVAWCEGASTDQTRWVYLYVQEENFEENCQLVEMLERVCESSLRDLLS